jgi:hypothetical protein
MAVDFDRLSISKISALAQILSDTKLEDKGNLRNLYTEKGIDFDAVVELFEDLGLLVSTGNTIVRSDLFMSNSTKMVESQAKLNEYLTDQVFNTSTSFSEISLNYLGRFRINNHRLMYVPSNRDRIAESGIRNLLMELNIVTQSSSNGAYYLADDNIHLVSANSERIFHKSQTPEELRLLQLKQQEIGDAAEIEVLKYEKNRLINRTDLVQMLNHVSQEDTRAGYDIESYEINSTELEVVRRLIEVKAVPIPGYRFYWSRNEIEIAKEFKERYYLYLLPHVGHMKFDMDKLEVIPHAYKKVFGDSGVWTRQEEKYSVWKEE